MDFNLFGSSLTDLCEDLDPPEFSYLDTLDSASLSQLDSLATQHLLQSVQNNRFPTPLNSEEFRKSLQDRIPKNTTHANKWSATVFNQWREWRLQQAGPVLDENYPIPDLDSLVHQEDLVRLDYWLSRFVYEARRQDGKLYPGSTLKNISAGIQRILTEKLDSTTAVNLFKKDDVTFRTFRQALEKRTKELIGEEVGVQVRHKDPVTVDDERILWDTGTFNTNTAEGMSYCASFYNSKVFGLGAMDEHVNLQADQFTIGTDEYNCKFLQFQGRLSKTVTGNTDCKARPKSLRHHADPTIPRCFVGIMEKYLAAIPTEGRFYSRPLPNKGDSVCFSQQPVGINTLSKYVQTMFNKAGIPWRDQHRNISNHSGKAACCTQLYENGFDEQAITMRSGHRSTAVRAYKQPSQRMLRGISNSLQPPKPATVTSATLKTEEATQPLPGNIPPSPLPHLLTQRTTITPVPNLF